MSLYLLERVFNHTLHSFTSENGASSCPFSWKCSFFFFCTTICCCWRRASDGAILCTAHWRGGHFTMCDPQKQHYVSIRNRPSGHFTTDSPERAPVAFYHVFIWLELNRTGNSKIIHLKIQPNLTFLTFTLSSWSKYTDVSSGGAIRGFLCRPDIIFFPSARCLRAAGK